MIYLLVIASLQAFSTTLSSSQSADAAAQHAGQVAQMRSLERLQVGLSWGGNVTIRNEGLIPSELSFLLLQNSSISKGLLVQESLAVGASVVVAVGSTRSFPSSVAVVTSLGNVFASSPSAGLSSGSLKILEAVVGGPDVDAQLYQNPGDPTRFFVAVGPSAFAFSASTGARLWSFNTSQGEVTDVLPLSDGGVYVSDGYYGDQFSASLFRLSSSGTAPFDYTMRLFRLYTTVVVQYPNNGQPPYPVGSQPVQKGSDGLYSFYDGWFFSSTGPSQTTVPADTFNLAGSDSSQFYVYEPNADPGGFGCTDPRGNSVTMDAYSATALGVQQQWSTPLFLNVCDEYPNELVASSAGSGVAVFLFSQTYWTEPNYFGGPYSGSNPFLAVLAASSGAILRSGTLDSNGYTSVGPTGLASTSPSPPLMRWRYLARQEAGTGSSTTWGSLHPHWSGQTARCSPSRRARSRSTPPQ